MTAHVRIRPAFPRLIQVICVLCGIEDAHQRWKPANAAALTHNDQHHPRKDSDR